MLLKEMNKIVMQTIKLDVSTNLYKVGIETDRRLKRTVWFSPDKEGQLETICDGIATKYM